MSVLRGKIQIQQMALKMGGRCHGVFQENKEKEIKWKNLFQKIMDEWYENENGLKNEKDGLSKLKEILKDCDLGFIATRLSKPVQGSWENVGDSVNIIYFVK